MAIKISGTTIIDDDRRLVDHRYTRVRCTTESATITADAGTYYVLEEAGITIVLPSTPVDGSIVGVINHSGSTTCKVRAGADTHGIMGINESDSTPEEMIIDVEYVPIQLMFSGGKGWILI